MLHLVLYYTVEGDSPTSRSLSFLVTVPPPMKPADRQVESWRCRLLQQPGLRCKGDLHKVSTINFLNFLSLHLCSLLFSLSFLHQQLCGFVDIHTTSKKSLQSSCSRPYCTLFRMGVCNFYFRRRLQTWLLRNLATVLIGDGARGGAVGWGTALQAGRSQVWCLIVSLEFFIVIILPAALRSKVDSASDRN
jgi:hypothetical protein